MIIFELENSLDQQEKSFTNILNEKDAELLKVHTYVENIYRMCMHICMYTTPPYTHTRTHAHTRTHTHTYTHIHIRAHTHTYTNTHTHTHTHTHTQTHAHKRTHRQCMYIDIDRVLQYRTVL